MTKRGLLDQEAEAFLDKQEKATQIVSQIFDEIHVQAAIKRIRRSAEDLLPLLHEASRTEVAAQLGYIISHCEDAEDELREKS